MASLVVAAGLAVYLGGFVLVLARGGGPRAAIWVSLVALVISVPAAVAVLRQVSREPGYSLRREVFYPRSLNRVWFGWAPLVEALDLADWSRAWFWVRTALWLAALGLLVALIVLVVG